MSMQKASLKFRKVSQSDLSLLKNWRNDPKIRHNNSQYFLLNNVNQKNWFSSISKKNSDRKMFIVTNEQNHPFAICGLINISKDFRSGEIAIIIGDLRFRGKGLGTKILNYLLRYGFFKLNFHRIEAKIFEYNVTSIKLFKKLNFQFEAKLIDSFWRENKWWSTLVYSILKHEYQNY